MDHTAVFYLLTIQNSNYDIEMVSKFVQLMITATEKFPTTFFYLLVEKRVAVKSMYSIYSQDERFTNRKTYKNVFLVWDFIQELLSAIADVDCRIYSFASYEKKKWEFKYGISDAGEEEEVTKGLVAAYWKKREVLYDY